MIGKGLKKILTPDEICAKRAEIELLVTKAVSALGDADKISREIGVIHGIEAGIDRHTFYKIGGDDHNIVKKIMQHVDKNAWRNLITIGGFNELMSVKEQRKMDNYIETSPALTIGTLRSTFAGLIKNRPDMLKDLIETAFTERDKKYKSNAGFGISKRQVIDSVFTGDSFNRNCHGYRVERLQDIVRAVGVITGDKVEGITQKLQRAGNSGEQYYEHGVMRFRVFKNGNVHIYIDCKKTLNAINDILAGCFDGQLGNM
jgi:hypothetical protein